MEFREPAAILPATDSTDASSEEAFEARSSATSSRERRRRGKLCSRTKRPLLRSSTHGGCDASCL